MSSCTFMDCRAPGAWRDEDDGRVYCEACVTYVAADAPSDALEAEMRERLADREEERREIADELRGERFDAVARRSW